MIIFALAMISPLTDLWTSTRGPIANHLWQSTIFAGVAALLTLALRHNQAKARYWLWFVASVKFLIPFSLLLSLGNQLAWSNAPTRSQSPVSFVVQEITEPFRPPQARRSDSTAIMTAARFVPALLLVAWFSGGAGVLVFWWLRWQRATGAVRGVLLATSGRELEALRRVEHRRRSPRPLDLVICESPPACTRPLEPGIAGVFRPRMLLPVGIADRLNDAELEAIITHELCHVGRRDNLAAALHMVVEVVFWFHPLVWWLGARLLDERERACDEEVVQLGSDPRAYAEGILRVCEFYLESPLGCVTGVTGSNLKRRIEAIMMQRTANKLGFGKKLFLAAMGAAAVVGPVAIGLLNPTPIRAQAQNATGSTSIFETVSITPNYTRGLTTTALRPRNDEFKLTAISLESLIEYAYGLRGVQVSGGPAWIASEKYDLTAKVPGSTSKAQIELALQKVLADRFKLTFHRELKDLPTYELVVGANGSKLGNEAPVQPGVVVQSRIYVNSGHLSAQKVGVGSLVNVLEKQTGRMVLDKTGLKGVYDFTLDWPAASSDPAASITKALPEQLGLELNPQTTVVELFVIDHVEKIRSDQ